MLSPAMVDNNPYQILTLIVAPALLTNSSALLSLSTSNRFGRVVDRTRALYDRLKKPDALSEAEAELYQHQLELLGVRSLLLVKALTTFYVAVGAFAGTTIISIFGASSNLLHHDRIGGMLTIIALLVGALGVGGIVFGASMLVREMWLAKYFLKMEIQLTQSLDTLVNIPRNKPKAH